MEEAVFHGRLGVQQRVLPGYRAAFFETLAGLCPDGLSVFAGEAGRQEAIQAVSGLEGAHLARARNLHLGPVERRTYLCWQGGLVQWLERWQPQALVVEANPRILSTRLAVSWMHRRGRRVLGWGLGAPGAAEMPAHFSWRQRLRAGFYRQFDGLIAYSRRGAAEYRALGMPTERVFVAPNAAAHRPDKMPERAAPAAEAARLLFVGRLQTRKRLDNLLRACAALPEALQPELTVVGEGPARAEFEAAARQWYPRARFVGAQHGAALEAYFAEADLFVLPGTGGLAVQQALASGLPVIAAQGDGTQDDLVRPENGWQAPPDDWQALAGALQAALADRLRLRAMGQASYRIAAEEANVEVMARAFVEALKQVQALQIRAGR